jgi:hypothetical protein
VLHIWAYVWAQSPAALGAMNLYSSALRALFTFTYPAQTHRAYNGVVISTKGSRTKSIKWLWQPATNTLPRIVCAVHVASVAAAAAAEMTARKAPRTYTCRARGRWKEKRGTALAERLKPEERDAACYARQVNWN